MDRRTFLMAAGIGLMMPALVDASEAEDTIKLRDLYNKDRSFSNFAFSREGEKVRVSGFMAPPLKADSNFFVLTKMPMAVCPFCETEAEWPDDILAVYTRRKYRVVSFSRKIVTIGVLSLGSFRDTETGFVSMVRIEQARYEIA